MSFGRPGAMSDNFKVSPPLRGSFPLDHEGELSATTNGSDGGSDRESLAGQLEVETRCAEVTAIYLSAGIACSLSSRLRPFRPTERSFKSLREANTPGECKDFMISYMSCLKQNRNNAGPCRAESRAYLECRMDKNLMSREDFQKLGLGDVQPRKPDDPPAATPASTSSASAKTAKEPSRGGWFGAGSASSSGGDSNERLV